VCLERLEPEFQAFHTLLPFKHIPHDQEYTAGRQEVVVVVVVRVLTSKVPHIHLELAAGAVIGIHGGGG